MWHCIWCGETAATKKAHKEVCKVEWEYVKNGRRTTYTGTLDGEEIFQIDCQVTI